jgi:hypothetical protein
MEEYDLTWAASRVLQAHDNCQGGLGSGPPMEDLHEPVAVAKFAQFHDCRPLLPVVHMAHLQYRRRLASDVVIEE